MGVEHGGRKGVGHLEHPVPGTLPGQGDDDASPRATPKRHLDLNARDDLGRQLIGDSVREGLA